MDDSGEGLFPPQNKGLIIVTVLSQPNCQPCNIVKRYLDKHGIVFEDINIQEDSAAYQKIIDLGYNTTPVIIAPDGTHFDGFRMDKLALLKPGA